MIFESSGPLRAKAQTAFLLAACAFVLFVFSARLHGETLRFKDLPLQVQKDLESAGITPENFGALIAQLRQISNERMADGEAEHLIYYVLQSNRFTKRPRIDALVSARQYIESLDASERARLLAPDGAGSRSAGEKISPDVLARMIDFRHILRFDRHDSRVGSFSGLVGSVSEEDALSLMKVAYMDTAQFLYKKELQAGAKEGEAGRQQMEAFYRVRGFDSDTQVEASFGVWQALEVIGARRSLQNAREPGTQAVAPVAELNNVLIVGPGAHFASSSGLDDEWGPQSYEPYAVADALLRLKLANPEKLRVQCIDLNPRVVQAIRDMRADKQPVLNLVSSFDRNRLSEAFAGYFRELGTAIGTETQARPPAAQDSRFRKSIAIRSEVAQAVNAEKLDVIAERLDGGPVFDLVIVSNVFRYFDKLALAFALTNISSMMKPGAYLVHNETDPHIESVSPVFGLSTVETSTFLLSPSGQPALMQAFVIQQKKRAAQKQ